MKDFKQTISQYSNKDLEQRKNWYSPAAEAYNKARPRYPQDIIHRVVELAQLSSEATILEIGCGPGIATVAFAQLGFSMVCLEPSREMCHLARQNCTQYPNVEIQNTTFEEWELEAERFNAVLAATSIHWIAPEVAYPKAANALQNNGSLILLWNVPAIPSYEVHQVLQEVYQAHAPSLWEYKGRENHEADLKGFEQFVIESGRFQDLVSEQVVSEVTYNIDDYLTLLSTFSPYIALDPQSRNSLFKGLREKIEQNFGGSIQFSHLCVFQIARKQ